MHDDRRMWQFWYYEDASANGPTYSVQVDSVTGEILSLEFYASGNG